MSQTKSTTSQKKPATNQKKPDVSKQKPATNQKNPAVSQKKPVSNTQKPAPKATKAPKTQAFDTVSKKKKAQKSPRERKRIVIAIFLVIILILSALAVILIGNILNKYKDIHNQSEQNPNVTYIEKSADDIKVGNLLWFTTSEFNTNVELQKVKEYMSQHPNDVHVSIDNTEYPTYALNNSENIYLESNTLNAFNTLVKQYCIEKISSSDIFNEYSASGLQIAWGGYTDKSEYNNDINDSKLGLGYCEHILGTSITLRKMPPYSDIVITESILKNEYSWIYENAHKYGFIISFPKKCTHLNNENGEDPYLRSNRLHFRYVGIEHATYIYENNICLDEYLELLREAHGFNNPLTFTAGDKQYQVYYVKYSGNPTQIPVLKDSNYSISGDNMNGFIVTVEK